MTILLQDNLRLGKKLATGGFGTVFKADLTDDENPNDVRSVIVKKVSPDCAHRHATMPSCVHLPGDLEETLSKQKLANISERLLGAATMGSMLAV